MKWFVFRNNTVEPFFDGKTVAFSGYDDVSVVPTEAEGFIWFYQVPVKFGSGVLAQEIRSITEKLQLVVGEIGTKPLVVFTMENLVDLKLVTSDMAVQEAIDNFNATARTLAQAHSHVKVVDFSEFTKRYTSQQLIDWKYYFISQSLLNPKIAKDFKAWWHRMEEELALCRKKCLVLDLDNTLWGGVLGEDGAEGIKIGGDYPGNAFLYWQQGLVELSKCGVILALCSKNNEADVQELWDANPFMALKREHISAHRINWQSKDRNIMELAEELNIGLDSMVFVDDNPTERELVRQMLPMVAVPDFPAKPYELVDFFQSLVRDYFRIYELTHDDANKVNQYKANAQRDAEQKRFAQYDDFLRSLDIEIRVEEANDFNLARIAQLTQKTNQFNLTTHRYTEARLREIQGAGSQILCMSVSDRFGSYGIAGVMIVNPIDAAVAEVDTLLLSCRVLGKGIEHAFVCHMLQMLAKNGYQSLTASYLPTAKNAQVKDFWQAVGGVVVSQTASATTYRIDLNQEFQIKNHYRFL